MNEPTNAPMLPPPSGVSEWFSVWRDAITRPSDQTFARIAQSPNAKLTTALLWVFLGSLVSSLLALPARGVWMRQMMQSAGLEGQFPNAAGGGLMTVICGAPIGAIISVVLFVIVVGIVQLLAKMFGGRGTFDQLAYAIAAIVTPFYLVSGILSLLSAIPFVVYCSGIVGFGLLLYVFILEVMAVKGVNQFEWWQAIVSLLLPVFAVICCLSLAVAGLFSMLAPQLRDMFNSIMTPVP
jgi:Yip1-like protein